MNITQENNFSETAFTVKEGEKYHLRWFTPGGEIDLCGHATLGAAFVLFRFYEQDADELVAYQASKRGGTLYCRREARKIFLADKAALYSIGELFVD